MTVNAARRARRRAAASTPEATPAPLESLAIGEIDQTVFDCPNCSRPLAIGVRRCPGCGTRLAMGVPLSKASVFVVVGLMVGFLAGGGAGLLVGLDRSTATAKDGALPSAAPVASSFAGSTSVPVASVAPIPSAAPTNATALPVSIQAALAQASTMDRRFAAAGTALAGTLAARTFDASAVAQTLRSMSADSLYASQVAQRLSGWPDTEALGGDLGTSYGRIHEVAEGALIASVRNEAAYRAAARTMLDELAALRTADARLVELAAADGVTLPDPSPAP
jgi:hypothetical protein